ncbi:MAG TPA: M28 family peptidase [Pirellulales bacterium]|nr:M28 family peptidase [Pirellulales bacterium]
MPKPSGQTIFLGSVLVASGLLFAYLFLFYDQTQNAAEPTYSRIALKDIPFDGTQAYDYLKKICLLGQRVSGSAGMAKQQELITQHFKTLGAKVERQEFEIRHPETGKPLTMTNLIVRFHPDRKERILLGTHYDTRPYPDRDPRNPKGKFLGANDGASGVALLMELGQAMPKFDSPLGVDFVFFDGEELIYDDNRDSYFLGSEHFAKNYAAGNHDFKYRWGVLLDMIGDSDLQIYEEAHSVEWTDTRELVNSIWGTAKKLGVREFIPQKKYDLRDDHVPLHDIGKISICDVIDFDYGPDHRFWHTQGDTPDHCSALSLAKVGWVMKEWLASLK